MKPFSYSKPNLSEIYRHQTRYSRLRCYAVRGLYKPQVSKQKVPGLIFMYKKGRDLGNICSGIPGVLVLYPTWKVSLSQQTALLNTSRT